MELLNNMFSLAPGDKGHEAAARCAVGVFVPLITLVLLDRVDLAICADRLAAAEGPPGHSARRRLTG